MSTATESMAGAAQRVNEAKDELRKAAEALIEASGDGWPLTPKEVAEAQARFDDALDTVVAASMWHGQLYERAQA